MPGSDAQIAAVQAIAENLGKDFEALTAACEEDPEQDRCQVLDFDDTADFSVTLGEFKGIEL